jgi:hypothetical protein
MAFWVHLAKLNDSNEQGIWYWSSFWSVYTFRILVSGFQMNDSICNGFIVSKLDTPFLVADDSFHMAVEAPQSIKNHH